MLARCLYLVGILALFSPVTYGFEAPDLLGCAPLLDKVTGRIEILPGDLPRFQSFHSSSGQLLADVRKLTAAGKADAAELETLTRRHEELITTAKSLMDAYGLPTEIVPRTLELFDQPLHISALKFNLSDPTSSHPTRYFLTRMIGRYARNSGGRTMSVFLSPLEAISIEASGDFSRVNRELILSGFDPNSKVWLTRFVSGDRNISTLHHELFHAMSASERMGVPVKESVLFDVYISNLKNKRQARYGTQYTEMMSAEETYARLNNLFWNIEDPSQIAFIVGQAKENAELLLTSILRANDYVIRLAEWKGLPFEDFLKAIDMSTENGVYWLNLKYTPGIEEEAVQIVAGPQLRAAFERASAAKDAEPLRLFLADHFREARELFKKTYRETYTQDLNLQGLKEKYGSRALLGLLGEPGLTEAEKVEILRAVRVSIRKASAPLRQSLFAVKKAL
jgi:hypothetical protein